jgi:hypothetical protein
MKRHLRAVGARGLGGPGGRATLPGPGRNPPRAFVFADKVSPTAASTGSRWARIALPALALVGTLCLALALGHPGSAGAAKAKQLGKTKQDPKPSCPGSTCEAVGSVTGFQQEADGEQRPFKVRQDGHIVAWSVDLSKPDRDQRRFFGDFYRDNEFDTAPAARLAILKGQGKSQFKLKRQSHAIELTPELGRTPVITLNEPLKVSEDDVIGITIPTWLPNFAVELSRENSWRASRSPSKCNGDDNIRGGRPHTEVGKSRRFGCTYPTARLLYWAYFVPARGGGNQGGGGGNQGGGGGNP